MAEIRAPLPEKAYHEGCSGCRVDRMKAESGGRIPYKDFSYVLIVTLSPAKKYPNTFSHSSFLGRCPYFLPCLVISIFAICVFISCIWLPETLHVHNENETTDGAIKAEVASQYASELEGKTDEVENGSTQNLFKNWPLMSSIIIFCIFCLHDVAYLESQEQRGAANGKAMTTMSIFKAIAPADGGVLFSWAQKRQVASFLPGDQTVFFILNVVEFIGLVLTFKFFLATPK